MNAKDFDLRDGKILQKKYNPKIGHYDWEEATPLDLLNCANEEAERVKVAWHNKEQMELQYKEAFGFKKGVEAVMDILSKIDNMKNY